MEHVGRIWFESDESSTAVSASVELSSDDRIIVRIGDRPAVEWFLEDVTALGEDPVTTITVDGDTVNFAPDDPDAWQEAIAAARMHVRLNRGVDQGALAVNPGGAGVVVGSYCHACGAPIDPRAEICPKCGVRQYTVPLRPYKSRVTAGLFAFFLGGSGAHHFYLGHTGLGILYLLFFWTFIPAFVAFFEALVFFFSSDASFDAKYNY